MIRNVLTVFTCFLIIFVNVRAQNAKPNFGQLAEQGVFFKNGYMYCMICSPFRAGFITKGT